MREGSADPSKPHHTPFLGYGLVNMLAFSADLDSRSHTVAFQVAYKVEALVKHESWKVRMDPSQGPREGFI